MSLINVEGTVHQAETPLFMICAIFSSLMYLICLLAIYPVLIALFLIPLGMMSQGMLWGHIRGNAIRVSSRQFPEIYAAAERISMQYGMPQPPVYILQSGGLLNAFATRFLMRDYVVLFSDIVELAYEQGQDVVNFIVAHELAHIRRGHLKWRWLIGPASLLPLLSNAYYRACEYTCDKMAAFTAPTGAANGILVLSAGKKLYKQVDMQAFSSQDNEEGGFWTWFSELFATHPHLTKRLNAVLALSFVRAKQAA
ncbi:MAG TPA: M48 family metallopeptidase [Coleofasciculaceae cyanobacterium]